MVYPDSDCWDNHGSVDSSNYMTKDGLYPTVFMAMINRLTGGSGSSGSSGLASLPYLSANADTITFQGFSAGCHFSHTMQVIHSATVKGTGLFECGPYMSQFADFSNNS